MVMMGAPGAGKGTQAKLLEEQFGIPQISTGDILREAQRNGTELGREAQRFMDQGLLVPDEVVIGIVAERLGRADSRAGFVLDGFPRTIGQAEALDALLARTQQGLDAVVSITVPQEELVQRLAGRRVCRQCGVMFHVAFDPPQQPGVCDRCGGALYQREDDAEETIRRRLELYATKTAPLVDYYRRAGVLREATGTGNREDVFRRVVAGIQ